ncbi:VCBS repeat-containing protein, partial [Caldithrix abyssi]|nr:VCBS repeat-containing protein [Caldithrix abyssi]
MTKKQQYNPSFPAMCLFIVFLISCGQPEPEYNRSTLFTLLSPAKTKLKFENRLPHEKKINVFKYRNYFNGGGVAIGDVNGDGLPDVYMVANNQKNKLFINKGDFIFKDVTAKADVSGSHSWSTGVSMVDINGDRKLDIYVCNSGFIEGDDRANEL